MIKTSIKSPKIVPNRIKRSTSVPNPSPAKKVGTTEKIDPHMKFDYKIRIRKDRSRKDGTSEIYIHYNLGSNKDRIKIYTKLFVKPVNFSEKDQRVIKCKEASDYNSILQQEVTKAYDIFVKHRLKDQALTVQKFKSEYNKEASGHDFIVYFEIKVSERESLGLIEQSTVNQHRSALEKLKSFKKSILFSEISADLLNRYKSWEVKKGNDYSTINTSLKNIRTYLNLATEEGIQFEYPFGKGKISVKQIKGKREALTQDELRKLIALYDKNELRPGLQNVLRYFLFSCFTGLRISDVNRVKVEDIVNDTLVFVPAKTKKSKKVLHIPLTEKAKSFIENEKGLLFNTISDIKSNEYLKVIQEKISCPKRLTFHVARHTFATIFLQLGGNVVTLKEILGHEKIETTMIYTHMNDETKRSEMNNFDEVF